MTSRNSGVVLVVDDAPDELRMLVEALESQGFTALVAIDGESALARLRRTIPDVVLLDARMPGIDGFETCRRLRAAPGMDTVPILFMTGMAETERIVEGLEAGGNDYLVKPVVPSVLIARIRAHLRVAHSASSTLEALERTGMALAAIDADGGVRWATRAADAMRVRGSDAGPDAARWARWLRSGGTDPLAWPEDRHSYGARALGTTSSGDTLVRIDPIAEGHSSGATDELTRRELDVLEWVAKGKTNRDIGDILGVSPRTVNKHLEHIYAKLGVETRTAAVAQFDRLQNKRG